MNTMQNTQDQAPSWSDMPVWRRRLNVGIIIVIALAVGALGFGIWNSFQDIEASSPTTTPLEVLDRTFVWSDEFPASLENDTRQLNGSYSYQTLYQLYSDGSEDELVTVVSLSVPECILTMGQESFTSAEQAATPRQERILGHVFGYMDANNPVSELVLTASSASAYFTFGVAPERLEEAIGQLGSVFIDTDICPIVADA